MILAVILTETENDLHFTIQYKSCRSHHYHVTSYWYNAATTSNGNMFADSVIPRITLWLLNVPDVMSTLLTDDTYCCSYRGMYPKSPRFPWRTRRDQYTCQVELSYNSLLLDMIWKRKYKGKPRLTLIYGCTAISKTITLNHQSFLVISLME